MGNWLLVPALQLEQRVNADPSTSAGFKLFLVQKYNAGVLFVLRYEHFFSSFTLVFFCPVYFPYVTPFNTVYLLFLL